MYAVQRDVPLTDRLCRTDLALIGVDLQDGTALTGVALRVEQKAAEYLNAVFDSAADAIVVTDEQGRYVDANPAACRLFGVEHDQLVGRFAADFCQAAAEASAGYDGLLTRDNRRGEYCLTRGDGSVRYVEYSVAQHFLGGRHLLILRDVTERRSLHETVFEIAQGVAAEIGENFFRALVQHLCRVLRVDAAYVAMLDIKANTLQTLAVQCNGAALENMRYPYSNAACAASLEHAACVCPTGAGQRFPDDPLLAAVGADGFYGCFLFNSAGKPIGLLGVADRAPLRELAFIETIMRIFSVRAASELQRNQDDEMLRHYAYHDSLTGLPNRMLFNDRLQQALVQAKRSGERIAVMFLDVDRLKAINDGYGHDCGDAALLAFSERMRRCLREGDTVARLGGDEFTVLLRNLGESGNAAAVAEKMLAAMQQPMTVSGNELYLTASIGISIYPDDGEDAYTLLRRADGAMYRSKNRGGNIFHFSMG